MIPPCAIISTNDNGLYLNCCRIDNIRTLFVKPKRNP